MTIKKKLIIIQLFTAFAVLAVSSAVFVQQEVRLFRANLVEQTLSTATLIGENSMSTLLFMDDRAAEQLLLSLNVEANITNACIYDGSGAVFAKYGREGHRNYAYPPAPAEQGHTFKDGFLELSRPIIRNDERIGSIFLRADLSQLGENIEEYVQDAILVLIIGLLFSALLAVLLQKTISRPILDLVTITRNVSETGDYSQRARQRRGDEIGVLSTAFNEMLELIQKRDVSLQEARETLEQRVEERTVELQGAKDRLEEALESEQLARTAADEARIAAEAANRTKSIFLANMSHEIRTPMNAILGYAQILGGYDDLSDHHQRAIRTIQTSGEHLLRLINDVLDISKIEAGRESLNPADFDLAGLIQDLGAMFDIRCAEKDLEWRLTNRDLPGVTVNGDESKLRQVLINLLANAVKFTESGSVSLEVESLGEDRYRFAVQDTGTGIEAEQIEQIFEPFHQTQAGMEQGGTGLGLAIAHHHVDMMGGQMKLDSASGQGARFEFTLILPAATQSAPSGVRQDYDWSHVEHLSKAQTVTALIVDDVETNRDILAQMLESVGVTIRTAAGGREALEKVRQATPDIVFMDIRMPDLDGEETLKQLIAEYGENVPKCVAVTASVFLHQRERYMQAGFDAFLDKPLQAERVYATLGQQLGVRFDFRQDEETHPVDGDWSSLEIPISVHEGLSMAAAEQSVSDLRRHVDTLAGLGEREREFADHLRSLADSYDLDGIRSVLEDVGQG